MKNCHNRYKPTVLNFQTQQRNETFTNNYNLAILTLLEIEATLLSIDENTDTDTFKANFVQNTQHNQKQQKEIIWYHCKQPGHIQPKCLMLQEKRQKKKVTFDVKANSTKHITLDSSTAPTSSVHVNMAKHGNAGRKLTNVPTSIPLHNDLSNWIMDSSCTCHMSPFCSDFIPTSFIYNKRTVKVADGSTVPAEQSGTIISTVFYGIF